MISLMKDSEKREDGEGYYFVNDDKGLPIGNKLLYCPYCGIEIKKTDTIEI